MFRKWNSEWEKSDPLRGRRGWVRHHYVAFGFAVAVFLIGCGVMTTTIARARQTEAMVDKVYRELDKLLGEAMTREARDIRRIE